MSLFTADKIAARRTARCPHCGHGLRLPAPAGSYNIACEQCLRLLQVTGEGVVKRDVTAHRGGEQLPLMLGKVTGKPMLRRSGSPGERGGAGGDGKPDVPSSGGGHLRRLLRGLRSVLIVLIALAAVAVATRSLLHLFQSVGHAAQGALLEGSMTAVRTEDADLGHERDLRLKAIRRYDRYMTRDVGDGPFPALWLELKRRDMEEIRILERTLGSEDRNSSP